MEIGAALMRIAIIIKICYHLRHANWDIVLPHIGIGFPRPRARSERQRYR
jgi:hypothetical protein